MKNNIIDAIFIVDGYLHLDTDKVDDVTGILAMETLLNDCKKRYNYEDRKCICKNCGKPFIAYNRTNTYYCDRISPQDSTKTCKQYGVQKTWNEKTKDENDWHCLYRRIYQSLQMKAKRNPSNPQLKENFDNFRIDANKWKKAVKEGTKTEKEFMKWLQDFRKI